MLLRIAAITAFGFDWGQGGIEEDWVGSVGILQK